MNLKKIFFSFLLINGLVPTIQANIIDSIINNDIEGMKRDYNENNTSFVQAFKDPNLGEIISPIHKAAMTADDPKILELLLYKGAHINKKSELGKTPLYYALTYNPNTDIARFLIDNGADVTTIGNYGGDNNIIFQVNNPNVYRSYKDKKELLELIKAIVFSNPQYLNDEDRCIVCYESIKTLAQDNVQNYKTNCCKQFLCATCISGIKESGRTISCPFCRQNPLKVNPVMVNIDNDTNQAFATVIPQLLTVTR
ncbi:ankyrin repeat domain-containing protein [Candidatus Babeliales bacterium]|nr:ankyrin repeat domain-containing protein [Candidatus Babeliales bacterium]